MATGDRERILTLKSLLLFGIAVALCVGAFAQSTVRWEQANVYAYNSYRYKSIGFQNVVVQVADAPPVRYGVRQFAAFRIVVMNEDKERRVELDSDRISCVCGRRKMLYAVPFRKIILPSRQIFAGNTIFSAEQLQRDRAVRWNLWSQGHAFGYDSSRQRDLPLSVLGHSA